MTGTPDEIQRLLTEADAMPWGLPEVALVARAVELADDLADEELAYRLRMRLTLSAAMAGDSDTQLSSFAWCLSHHDADAARFPQKAEQQDLLWQYKWMPTTLAAHPDFPLEEIDAVLDDMERRYREAGAGISGILTARFSVAGYTGRDDLRVRYMEELERTPRDYYSHCEACTRNDLAEYLTETGNERKALAVLEEIFEQGYDCADEPERSLADAMPLYLRAGEFEKAASAHRSSYRSVMTDRDDLAIVADHVEFCAMTGNLARGLAIAERHLTWFLHDALSMETRFRTAGAYGVLLERLTEAGHGDSPVRGTGSPQLAPLLGPLERDLTISEAADAFWRTAQDIADRFDVRNGNTAYAEELLERHQLVHERYDVPLDGGDVLLVAAPDLREPESAEEWLMAAREAAALLDRGRLRRALDELSAYTLDDGTALVVLSYELHQRLALAGESEPEDPHVAQLLADRIALLRRLGRDERADAETSIGALLYRRPESDEEFARLQEVLETATDPELVVDVAGRVAELALGVGDVETASAVLAPALAAVEGSREFPDSASVVLLAAHIRGVEGRFADGIVLLDRLLDRAAELDRGLLASAHGLRARLSASAGELPAALDHADKDLDLRFTLEDSGRIVGAAEFAARVLGHLDRYDEAVSRWRVAVRSLELAEGADTAPARVGLGEALVDAGRSDEAYELLVALLAELDTGPAEPERLIGPLHQLSRAARRIGEPGAAYRALTRLVELMEREGSASDLAGAELELASLLLDYRSAEAVERLDSAIARIESDQELLSQHVDALHLRGRARIVFEDADGVEDFDRALALLESAEGAGWVVADIRDSKATALDGLGRGQEAVALHLLAADGYAEAGDTVSAGRTEYEAGAVLLAAGRAEEAAGILESATGRLAGGPPHLVTAAWLELGRAYEALGRGDEAKRAFARAESAEG